MIDFVLRSKSPNPLKKGAKIRILVPRLVRYTVGEPEQYAHPLFKGDLGGFRPFALALLSDCV